MTQQSKELKVYNPLRLNIEKDEPSFMAGENKFWIVHLAKPYAICRVVVANPTKDTKGFVLFKGKDILADSDSFEAICVQLTVHQVLDKKS